MAPEEILKISEKALAARGKDYLSILNDKQREAVKNIEGPLLVLAGAGTGKTRALTARVSHILNMQAARPDEILAVTFTNKAAREMKKRIEDNVKGVVEGMPWIGTFHSLCAKLLRRHAELVNLKSNFTILDTDDQLRLLKQLIKAENIDEKRWPARLLAGVIDRWKNKALSPENIPESELVNYNSRGQEFYSLYQNRLKVLNAVDFGDLLLHMVAIFKDYSEILIKYQNRFKYILVDEYQDTNVVQYLWLRLLAGSHKNICCVGDDDQSIYGWRGAEVANILRFEKDFPQAKVVRLEQNYRSTSHILSAASGVIKTNESRLGKELWTKLEGGDKVRVIGHWDGDDEARWISEEIESFAIGTRGHKPITKNEIAILVRASFQMRAFEDRFLTSGIAYRVIGGPRFYERAEIRDALAYFRATITPEDGLAFERILNVPKRGLGDKALQKMNLYAREKNIPLMQAAKEILATGVLSSKANESLRNLLDHFNRWQEISKQNTKTHIELAELILDESGYTEMWKIDRSPDAPGRLENLKELIQSLETFENIESFLEHISLVMENEENEETDKVSIMTLHASKGLEFETTFLPGWEDGLFPSQRSMDQEGKKGTEEERRLAYVGITRAKRHCVISFASNRRIYNQWQNSIPSRFVDELPSKNVEILNPPGLYSKDKPTTFNSNNIDENRNSGRYNSPGWGRLKFNNIENYKPTKTTNSQIINSSEIVSFAIKERVFHQKFGYGVVVEIEGEKILVNFEKAGEKNVMASYLFSENNLPF